jgi:hypothetical protein
MEAKDATKEGKEGIEEKKQMAKANDQIVTTNWNASGVISKLHQIKEIVRHYDIAGTISII